MRKYLPTTYDLDKPDPAQEAPKPPAGHTPLSGPEIQDVKRKIVQGTAEFVRRYKRDLHARGFFHLDLPLGAELPLWLQLVFEELRLRMGHWQVQSGERGNFTRYRVRWLGWMKNAKRRPR